MKYLCCARDRNEYFDEINLAAENTTPKSMEFLKMSKWHTISHQIVCQIDDSGWLRAQLQREREPELELQLPVWTSTSTFDSNRNCNLHLNFNFHFATTRTWTPPWSLHFAAGPSTILAPRDRPEYQPYPTSQLLIFSTSNFSTSQLPTSQLINFQLLNFQTSQLHNFPTSQLPNFLTPPLLTPTLIFISIKS